MENGYGVLTEMERKWPVRIRLASGNVRIIIHGPVWNYFIGLKHKAQSLKLFSVVPHVRDGIDKRHITTLSFSSRTCGTISNSHISTLTTLTKLVLGFGL